MMTVDSSSPSALHSVVHSVVHTAPVETLSRPHPETSLDLDPSRVVDASDTFSVGLSMSETTATTRVTTHVTLEPPVVKGIAKHLNGRSAVYATLSGDTVIGEYGQDHVMTLKISGDLQGKPFSVWVLGCADGHGTHGEVASRRVLDYVKANVTSSLLGEVLEGVCAGQEAPVHQCLDAFYTEMDESTKTHVHDGTTLSLLFVMEYEGRVFVVASNVGDSPMLLVNNETGHVTRLHGEHNWDSVKERRVQLEASREAGRDDAVVIYNRFNCENGTTFRDHRGGCEIIPVFREGTDEVLEETREHIMLMSKLKKWVGGTQSVRRMKKLYWDDATEQWEEEALEEFGHENFGSTPLIVGPDLDDFGEPVLHGGCQMTRCLGDFYYKDTAYASYMPLVLNKPSVTVMELSSSVGKDFSVVVCSDGIGDAFYWHQLGDVFREVYSNKEATSKEAATALFRQTMMNGRRVFRLPSTVTAWDDLSMVVGRVKLEVVEREL